MPRAPSHGRVKGQEVLATLWASITPAGKAKLGPSTLRWDAETPNVFYTDDMDAFDTWVAEHLAYTGYRRDALDLLLRRHGFHSTANATKHAWAYLHPAFGPDTPYAPNAIRATRRKRARDADEQAAQDRGAAKASKRPRAPVRKPDGDSTDGLDAVRPHTRTKRQITALTDDTVRLRELCEQMVEDMQTLQAQCEAVATENRALRTIVEDLRSDLETCSDTTHTLDEGMGALSAMLANWSKKLKLPMHAR